LLPKRQIATQDGVAVPAESSGESHKQWRIAIAASAVGEDDGIARRLRRRVQDAAYGGINRFNED
jgi:hypothetical protein